tara:strand:- start:85 stop:264 length:180 start_codon:yes stop_codon:yes gene_type:complete
MHQIFLSFMADGNMRVIQMKVFIVKDVFEMKQAMTFALEGNGHSAKSSVAGATAILQIS